MKVGEKAAVVAAVLIAATTVMWRWVKVVGSWLDSHEGAVTAVGVLVAAAAFAVSVYAERSRWTAKVEARLHRQSVKVVVQGFAMGIGFASDAVVSVDGKEVPSKGAAAPLPASPQPAPRPPPPEGHIDVTILIRNASHRSSAIVDLLLRTPSGDRRILRDAEGNELQTPIVLQPWSVVTRTARVRDSDAKQPYVYELRDMDDRLIEIPHDDFKSWHESERR